ncbi:MAG: 5'-3' exonuclease H3TH domain-containing protein, partial [Candidatus Harrisonbacteria bacterium]|nr:5'-3' exonuclease H3TH domain-containing protein [Candidatus Harrisonbacteria bacterium]
AQYKATRMKAEDDLITQIISSKEVFDAFKIKVFEMAGFEADDIIGTLAERYKKEKNLQTIVYSGDRDMLQLVEGDKIVVDLIRHGGVVEQYNEEKVKEVFGISPAQITDLKGLVGDSSDNIPGVSGIGPKSATPLIQEWGSVEEVYENLMIISPKVAKKLEGSKEQALMSKRLATIERNVPAYFDSLEDLKAVNLNREGLTKYFSNLGFVSLVRQVEEKVI